MKLQRLAAFGAATLATIGLTLGAASPVLAHDELIDSSLEFAGDSDALSAIALTFNNNIMEVGTEFVVLDPSGVNISSASPELSGATVRQPLEGPFAEGTYQVVWRVVSSDGHPIQGELAFTVAADGTAEMTAVEDTHDEHEHEHAEEATAGASDGAADGLIATREESSFPVGGWIALGAVIVVGAGAFAFLATRKKKGGSAN